MDANKKAKSLNSSKKIFYFLVSTGNTIYPKQQHKLILQQLCQIKDQTGD